MSRVKKLFTTITLIVAMSISSPVFATADSTLSQVIRDIDCTHTTLENGNQLNHPDCQIFAPKFMKLDSVDKKRPVLYSVYDAVHTVTNPVTGQHDLVVEFNGRTFVLGRDSELRVNGNVWTLDFSNWQNNHPGDNFMPLTPGYTYNGRATAKMKASPSSPEVTQFADFSVTIPKQTIGEIFAVPDIVKKVGRVLASTGISMWLMITISATAIFVASILLLIRKKEEKRDG
jgi:hypothetical protein